MERGLTERNDAIYRSYLDGLTPVELSEKYGVTVRIARLTVKRRAARRTRAEVRP
jgi:uncharacterized membrane protein YqgA involved in biofilm formation